MTSCHIAINCNDFDTFKLLVDRGANLDVVDSDGHSLLSIVARLKRNTQFVILLLDAGAPIDGMSSEDLLSLVKSVAVFERLVARGVDFTAMRDDIGRHLCHHMASNVTSEDDFRCLVNSSNDIHEMDDQGRTPLHWASSGYNDSAVRVLVELGAEIDQFDIFRWTPLFHAAGLNTQSSCVALLLALGADVGLVDMSGQTACHIATSFRGPASLCWLVAAGSDLDQRDDDGETPRMIAIRENVPLPTADEIDAARRRMAKIRLDLVRERAFQICLGLHPLDINALQLCEILMHSFGAIGSVILFHQWWAIAVKVKHFRDRSDRKQRWWAKLKLFRGHKQSSATTTTSATSKETQ
jgi:ankyrin repeat protein